MSSKNVTVLVALILILFIGGFFYIRSQQTTGPTQPQPTQPEQTPTPSPQELFSASPTDQTQEVTVEINANGFSPDKITIKASGKVTWVNNDTQNHQVNSAVHPTHLVYPPLNTIGLLKPAEKKSLIFPDKGTYKYHNHLNPQLTGLVVVQ